MIFALLLSLSVNITAYANNSSRLPGPFDTFTQCTEKLYDFTLVDQAALPKNVKIIITKDYDTSYGVKVNLVKIYFTNDQIQKIEFEIENPKDKDKLLQNMKTALSDGSKFIFSKKVTDENGVHEENYQWEGFIVRGNLIYTKEGEKERLLEVVTMDWNPSPLMAFPGPKV